MNRAIVGGIALELVDLALGHIRDRALGRPSEVDREEVLSRAVAGVATGKRALIDEVDAQAARIATIREGLSADADLSRTL